ncbi:MAG: hypothetical protein AAF764_07295 [Pseudomonadota bacterium]
MTEALSTTDPVLRIARSFNPAYFKFTTTAPSVFLECCYEGYAAQFWASDRLENEEAMRAALSPALAQVGPVHYLTHAKQPDSDVRLSGSEPLSESLWRFWHRREPVALRRAVSAEQIEKMFDQHGFSWSMEWQRCFLFKAGIEEADREIILREPAKLAKENFEPLWHQGVAGYLVPGVDGACAALFSPDRQLCDSFARRLDTALSSVGLPTANTYFESE